MDAFVGEIRAFGFGFTPYGWMLCAGQLLPISQYTTLYALLGTYYGGNGTSNFQLPNLQGTVPNGVGQLPGGELYSIGETGGTPTVTLISTEIPVHTHNFVGANATNANSAVTTPTNQTYITNSYGKANPTAPAGILGRAYAPAAGTPVAHLNPLTVGVVGSNLAHENRMPYVAMNYCICYNGEFPQRS